jgi:endonuclease/exonuclease/phosphatase family metal-dependent hydrolase
MKILSCNIRDARADDGDNNWAFRKKACITLLRQQQADVICFQEMRHNQQHDIAAALPEYKTTGLAEAPPALDAPNTLFYRNSCFRLLAQSGCWLSDTPDTSGSRSWGSAYIRLANWVLLQHTVSNTRIRIINTHLEDDNPAVAAQQVQVMTQHIPPANAGELQIITGDMNSDASSPALQFLFDNGWHDTYNTVHHTHNPGYTFHAFQGEQYSGATLGKIDWILTREHTHVLAAEIIRDRIESRFPSDHYFISATIDATHSR